MNGRRLSIGLRAALAIVTVTLFVTSSWAQAPWEKVLYNFNGDDWPSGGLVMDTRGNLYGTTYLGGIVNGCYDGWCGTVFQLSHKVGGGWAYTVLHTFNGADGGNPAAGLIFDARGNLYGTTRVGGARGYGTVFQLRQQGVGRWTERVLHSFNPETDGGFPTDSLILDARGNLYGTTTLGTVFELSPEADGNWTEKVLYRPTGGPFGANPEAGLVMDTRGNLYGTTYYGGNPNYDCGMVFELSPQAGGGWTGTVLHTFNQLDGCNPAAGVIFDGAGNLYGTTAVGGDYREGCGNGCGTVFELSPEAGGGWTEKVLDYGGYDAYPSGLIVDAAGNLYGTTFSDGAFGDGTVFEMSPDADGGWTYTVLHSFDPKCHDGAVVPNGGSLIFDAAGNLYGMTSGGGAYGYGTVFEIVR